MKINKKRTMFLAILLAVIMVCPALSQITGANGLMTIPTAKLTEDGELQFGLGYLPAKYSILRQIDFGDQFYYITLGYLPFLETSIAIVRSDKVGKAWGIGDRVILLRFKIISESKKFPAIVLGLHDPMGFIGEAPAQHFNASYLVTSKRLYLIPTLAEFFYYANIDLHLGYGVDWVPSAKHQFVGFFGGAELFFPRSFFSLMLEYDAEKVNGGIRLDLFNHFKCTIAWLGMEKLGLGLRYSFGL